MDMMRKVMVVHQFMALEVPEHPDLHQWSECFRKSVDLDYLKIHKEGLMKINPKNPIKELDFVMWEDIYELKYVGQVNEETNRPEGLGLAIKINGDY